MKSADSQGETPERRKHARFPMKRIVHGVLRTNSGEEELGQIIDIGRGGLALRYFVGSRLFNDIRYLDIMGTNPQLYIENIRVRSVFVMGLKSHLPFPRVAMRRMGICFEGLTPRQAEQLDALIVDFARPGTY